MPHLSSVCGCSLTRRVNRQGNRPNKGNLQANALDGGNEKGTHTHTHTHTHTNKHTQTESYFIADSLTWNHWERQVTARWHAPKSHGSQWDIVRIFCSQRNVKWNWEPIPCSAGYSFAVMYEKNIQSLDIFKRKNDAEILFCLACVWHHNTAAFSPPTERRAAHCAWAADSLYLWKEWVALSFFIHFFEGFLKVKDSPKQFQTRLHPSAVILATGELQEWLGCWC